MSLKAKFKKRAGNFVLDVAIECGNDVLALFGESGSGKSMTLKCIAGILKPDEGFIELDGKTFFDSDRRINIPPQERKTGCLFQNYALFPNMTVAKNIACGMRKKDNGKIEKIIDTFLLRGLENQYPTHLSGGQQQRTALARIMVSEPDILLLDEPFSALDTHIKWSLEQEMSDLIDRFGKTVIFVSHNRDEVFDIADNVCFIEKGKNSAIRKKHEAFLNPDSAACARLCGFRNIYPVVFENGKTYIPSLNINIDGGNKNTKCVAVKNDGISIKAGKSFIVKRVIYGFENNTVILDGKNDTVTADIGKNDISGVQKGCHADICINNDAVLFLNK